MSKIEETRREMYIRLSQLKDCTSHGLTPDVSMPAFEDAMESHLETLRQDQQRLIELTAAYQQEAKREAHENFEAREQVRILTKKLDKKSGRISQIKAWMRAAVRDNKRVRAEKKELMQRCAAYEETQSELITAIQHLNAQIVSLEARVAHQGCTKSCQPIPSQGFDIKAAQKQVEGIKP